MTEKSPFESMTPESIKSEMLGRVINAGVDVDAREGSYANVLLSEAAYVMWKYGQTLNGFIDILFPSANSGPRSACSADRYDPSARRKSRGNSDILGCGRHEDPIRDRCVHAERAALPDNRRGHHRCRACQRALHR